MSDTQDIANIRREYRGADLSESNLNLDPIAFFEQWFGQAQQAGEKDPTAMTLATYSKSNGPAARIVLLKQFGEQGFCWYTDYDSHKGEQLAEQPRAELLFYWSTLERQVRIGGEVYRLDRAQAEHYFNERPAGSRYSAAASDQSCVVDGRATLEQRVAELQQAYPEGDVPCPDNWGGYCLVPSRFEFWQGRENRLHDRFQYRLTASGWQIDRLCP